MDAPMNYPGNPPSQFAPQPVQPRRSAGGTIFRWIVGLILFMGMGFMALMFLVMIAMVGSLSSETDDHVTEKYHSLEKHGEDKVAIIMVEGAIIDGEGFVKHQIDHVRNDDSVKA